MKGNIIYNIIKCFGGCDSKFTPSTLGGNNGVTQDLVLLCTFKIPKPRGCFNLINFINLKLLRKKCFTFMIITNCLQFYFTLLFIFSCINFHVLSLQWLSKCFPFLFIYEQICDLLNIRSLQRG